MERVSHQATFGDRDTGHRAGRADPLQVLTSAQRGACPASPIDEFLESELRSSSRSFGVSSERTDNDPEPVLGGTLSRMAFVGGLLVGVVVHFRHDEPRTIRLALENTQRVIVPKFDLASADQLLTFDL